MGYKLYPNEESYIEAKAKAYKKEQENRKIINDKEHFNAALLETTSEVFKPITKKQDDSLKEEKEIVKQLKDLTAMKEEPKQEEVEKKEEIKKIVKEKKEDDEEEHNETLSKNECMDLINSDDNIDELFVYQYLMMVLFVLEYIQISKIII